MYRSIKVGVYNWTEFSRSNGFYPLDIPQEWRLTYFSNEFASACVSLATLQQNTDMLAQWCEDLPDSFELSFCIDHLDQIKKLSTLQQQVSVKVRYLVIESADSGILSSRHSLQPLLYAAGISEDRLIISPDLWRPKIAGGSGSTLALFPATDSLRLYREWIDEWLQSTAATGGDEDLTLWLPGSETGYRLLSDCKTLVEMMGY